MNYDYLKKEKHPAIFLEAMKQLGVKEISGAKHNPVILGWAKALGLQNVYTADEIAWCGLFVAYCCHAAGLEVVNGPLWARNWANWGTKQPVAMLGDVLVFARGSGGHVGIYVGEDSTAYHVLGGNQGDSVSIVRVAKSRCIGIRRTAWKVAQPKNVRVIKLMASGAVSENEA